jgi:hypothetical protein
MGGSNEGVGREKEGGRNDGGRKERQELTQPFGRIRFGTIVDGGHRGIKYQRIGGVSDTVYEEGTHFVVSFFLSFPFDFISHRLLSLHPDWFMQLIVSYI